MCPKTKKTTKTLFTLTIDLYKELVKRARETFGVRQGYLSMYVEMTLRKELGLNLENVEES